MISTQSSWAAIYCALAAVVLGPSRRCPPPIRYTDTMSLPPTTKNMKAKTQIACHMYPKFKPSSASSRLRPNPAKSTSQERSRLWSGRTRGRSGDRYIARIATIPKAVETIASTDVAESRYSRSRSLGLKVGSPKTSRQQPPPAAGSRAVSILKRC